MGRVAGRYRNRGRSHRYDAVSRRPDIPPDLAPAHHHPARGAHIPARDFRSPLPARHPSFPTADSHATHPIPRPTPHQAQRPQAQVHGAPGLPPEGRRHPGLRRDTVQRTRDRPSEGTRRDDLRRRGFSRRRRTHRHLSPKDQKERRRRVPQRAHAPHQGVQGDVQDDEHQEGPVGGRVCKLRDGARG